MNNVYSGGPLQLRCRLCVFVLSGCRYNFLIIDPTFFGKQYTPTDLLSRIRKCLQDDSETIFSSFNIQDNSLKYFPLLVFTDIASAINYCNYYPKVSWTLSHQLSKSFRTLQKNEQGQGYIIWMYCLVESLFWFWCVWLYSVSTIPIISLKIKKKKNKKNNI